MLILVNFTRGRAEYASGYGRLPAVVELPVNFGNEVSEFRVSP